MREELQELTLDAQCAGVVAGAGRRAAAQELSRQQINVRICPGKTEQHTRAIKSYLFCLRVSGWWLLHSLTCSRDLSQQLSYTLKCSVRRPNISSNVPITMITVIPLSLLLIIMIISDKSDHQNSVLCA